MYAVNTECSRYILPGSPVLTFQSNNHLKLCKCKHRQVSAFQRTSQQLLFSSFLQLPSLLRSCVSVLRCLFLWKVSCRGLNGGDGFFIPSTVEALAKYCPESGCCHLLRASAGPGAPDYTSPLLHASVAFV